MDFINMNFFSRLGGVDNIQFGTYTESKKLEDLNGVDSFFMGGIPGGIGTGKNGRAKSCDIKNKNYFVLDFDVREAYMSRTGEKLSDEDLMKKGGDIKDLLDKDSFYKEWSYFVFTGNGFHVYYIGKSRYINPEVHTFALKYIHKKCDEITNNPDFKVDPSLKNIARYSRVPGSYNFKRKEKHGLDPAEVYIMHEKDIESRLFNNLEEISKRYLEKIKKDQQLNIVHRDYGSSSNVIDAIQNINVGDIFSSHTKHRFADNGKNFLSNKSGLLGCFYDKENNLLIKDGTEHINSDYEGYSPFLYVRAEVKGYGGSKNSKFDSKVNEEVFQRFEDNYPHISSLAKESRKEFAKAQEEKEKNKDLGDIIVDKNNADGEYHGMLYTTGLNIITETVGHIWDNESAIVHGPSKHGKTTYTLSMANENGRRGVKVAYFSLEMSKHNLKMQQGIVRSGLTRPEFETKSYSQEQLEVYKKYYNGFDEFFTLIGEEDLPEENEDGFTLNALIQYMKKMVDDGYQMFIVDSLKLIKKDNSFSGSENERYSKCVKSVKEFKNLNPCCVILIHHNNKFGKTFDGSQDLENFVDWRISVNKYIDPSADGISIFHQTKIRIHKERIGNELEFTFDYDRGNLIYNCHGYITEDL